MQAIGRAVGQYNLVDGRVYQTAKCGAKAAGYIGEALSGEFVRRKLPGYGFASFLGRHEGQRTLVCCIEPRPAGKIPEPMEAGGVRHLRCSGGVVPASEKRLNPWRSWILF
jgi:hypothetical protein